MNDSDLSIEDAPKATRPVDDSSDGSAPKATRSRAGKDSKHSRLENDLDRLSLVQALHDTEAATARVIDLTERLVDAREQNRQLRGDLERLRIDYHQYQAEQEAMRGSAAFRLASLIWNIRNALHL